MGISKPIKIDTSGGVTASEIQSMIDAQTTALNSKIDASGGGGEKCFVKHLYPALSKSNWTGMSTGEFNNRGSFTPTQDCNVEIRVGLSGYSSSNKKAYFKMADASGNIIASWETSGETYGSSGNLEETVITASVEAGITYTVSTKAEYVSTNGRYINVYGLTYEEVSVNGLSFK